MPSRSRALTLLPLPALLGCALQLEARTPFYRGTTTQPTSDKTQNSASTALSSRVLPSRGQGAFLGLELEAAMCLDTSSDPLPEPRRRARERARASDCPRGLEIRNSSLITGFTLLPGAGKIPSPGFDVTFEAGLGEPAGPRKIDGTWYHLGTGLTLVLPFNPRDLEPGYVIAGYGLEFVTGLRAGLWAPPADPSDAEIDPATAPPLPIRAVTVESTFMLGLRLRAFSDIIGIPGYPRPRRGE
jgi:hypothetical protein